MPNKSLERYAERDMARREREREVYISDDVALSLLKKQLSNNQIAKLAELLEFVSGLSSFGAVTITIKNTHPHIIKAEFGDIFDVNVEVPTRNLKP